MSGKKTSIDGTSEVNNIDDFLKKKPLAFHLSVKEKLSSLSSVLV